MKNKDDIIKDLEDGNDFNDISEDENILSNINVHERIMDCPKLMRFVSSVGADILLGEIPHSDSFPNEVEPEIDGDIETCVHDDDRKEGVSQFTGQCEERNVCEKGEPENITLTQGEDSYSYTMVLRPLSSDIEQSESEDVKTPGVMMEQKQQMSKGICGNKSYSITILSVSIAIFVLITILCVCLIPRESSSENGKENENESLSTKNNACCAEQIFSGFGYSKTCPNTNHDGSCTVNCYENYSGHSATYVCENGKWNENEPSCTKNEIPNSRKDWILKLNYAVKNGDENSVESVLNECHKDGKKLIDVVIKEEDQIAVRHALVNGNKEIVKFLLHEYRKEDKNQLMKFMMKQNTYNNTVLHLASHKGNEETVKLLLDVFRDDEDKDKLIDLVMKENKRNYTALFIALDKENEKIVKLLLYVFREEDKKQLMQYVMKEEPQDNYTALHIASNRGNEKIVKLLLDVFREEDKEQLMEYVMKEDTKKITALHYAAAAATKQNEEIVTRLLNVFGEENKSELIDFVIKEDIGKDTALHLASQTGNEQIVALLLDVFYNEDEYKNKLIEFMMKENGTNNTALHYASEKGNAKIVTLLLNVFGEDKNKLIEFVMKKDKLNNTALHYASHKGYKKIVKLLLKTFSEDNKEQLMEYVMKENKNKETALHYASQTGNEQIVILLLDVFREDENELIKFIEKKNTTQQTALSLALLEKEKLVKLPLCLAQKHEKIIELLETKYENAKAKIFK